MDSPVSVKTNAANEHITGTVMSAPNESSNE